MSDESKSCSVPSTAEPTATPSTVPMWIVVATLLLLFIGFVFFDRHSGWFDAKVYAPYASAEQLDNAQPKSGAAAQMAQGKKNYEMFCGACHGTDGAGKLGQAPPLAGSEIVITKGFHRLAMIPLEGLSGPIKIKSQDWNLVMAPMGAALPDADLAAVLTYMRNSWGNKAGEVTADDVKAIKAEIKTPTAIQGDKLMGMPE
ncbi:MAG TPA: cytochrome c [Candidatus Acidoferrales bacterium]|jgi:mono/diheme cytochrome c family protein|nr:cytochrome c [Candidatus Acidoferrales bacterium]